MFENIFKHKEHYKLITAILPKGKAKPLIEELQGKGITTANLNNARGAGPFDPVGKQGLPDMTEVEMLNVTVPADKTDEIFELIYEKAEMDQMGGGLMYVAKLQHSFPFALPDL